jgi:hypothetical protein
MPIDEYEAARLDIKLPVEKGAETLRALLSGSPLPRAGAGGEKKQKKQVTIKSPSSRQRAIPRVALVPRCTRLLLLGRDEPPPPVAQDGTPRVAPVAH